MHNNKNIEIYMIIISHLVWYEFWIPQIWGLIYFYKSLRLFYSIYPFWFINGILLRYINEWESNQLNHWPFLCSVTHSSTRNNNSWDSRREFARRDFCIVVISFSIESFFFILLMVTHWVHKFTPFIDKLYYRTHFLH